MQRPPAVNAALLQSVQCFLTESRVVPAHLLHKQFGLFAHCGAISRAAAFDDGQPGVVYRAFYLAFGGKDHWPDQRNLALVQIGHGRKTPNTAFPPKVHVKSLHGIIQVVPQRHFVAAKFLRGSVQCPAPHFGTQRAGVRLFAVIKYHRADIRAPYFVRNAFLRKQVRKWLVVGFHPAKARVQRDRHDLKRNAEIPPQVSQRHGQRNAVLPAGNTNAYPVARCDHLVILYCLAQQTLQALHARSTLPLYTLRRYYKHRYYSTSCCPMPTAAAKSEEFYQSTAQELQKQSRARAAVWLAKQGRGENRKPADCTKRAEHFAAGYTKTGAKGKTVKCRLRKR